MYVFTKQRATADRIIRETVSGGVTVNDWGWHVVNLTDYRMDGVLIGLLLLIAELNQNRDMMRAQVRHDLVMGIVDLL